MPISDVPPPPPPEPDYTFPAPLSVEELKKRLDHQLPTHDDVVKAYLLAAVEQAQAPPPYGCGRLLRPDPATGSDRPVAKPFPLHAGQRRVRVPDAREIAEVTVDSVVTTGYAVLERHGHVVQLELPAAARSSRVIAITGQFGFLEVPATLAEAIYILAARMFYEQGAQYADQVAIAEGVGVQAYYRQLPPRTKLAFASYAVADGVGFELA